MLPRYVKWKHAGEEMTNSLQKSSASVNENEVLIIVEKRRQMCLGMVVGCQNDNAACSVAELLIIQTPSKSHSVKHQKQDLVDKHVCK